MRPQVSSPLLLRGFRGPPRAPWNTVWEPLPSGKELRKSEQGLNRFSHLSSGDHKIGIFISTFHKLIIDGLNNGEGLAVPGTE